MHLIWGHETLLNQSNKNKTGVFETLPYVYKCMAATTHLRPLSIFNLCRHLYIKKQTVNTLQIQIIPNLNCMSLSLSKFVLVIVFSDILLCPLQKKRPTSQDLARQNELRTLTTFNLIARCGESTLGFFHSSVPDQRAPI